MVRVGVCLLAILSGCAHVIDDDGPSATTPPGADLVLPADAEGRDFAARVEGSARCEEAARARLAYAPDEAWRELWGCVCKGHFTALRNVVQGAWDHELQTRPDAPMLVARIIADRGGDVDSDLRLVHDRRVPLFGLRQALARPELLRGALVILRGRVSPGGVLDETKLVGQSWEVRLGPTERVITRADAPFGYDTSRLYTQWNHYNLDVATGTRTLAQVNDPFLDPGDSVVVLGRFEGLRDSDAWPVVTVLDHYRPSATVAY